MYALAVSEWLDRLGCVLVWALLLGIPTAVWL